MNIEWKMPVASLFLGKYFAESFLFLSLSLFEGPNRDRLKE